MPVVPDDKVVLLKSLELEGFFPDDASVFVSDMGAIPQFDQSIELYRKGLVFGLRIFVQFQFNQRVLMEDGKILHDET